MQCTYCKVKQENKKICSFCEADLTQERPKKKQTLSQEEAYQTQPELSKYHTYDLLLLLSYLREQRSTAYKTMQSVRKRSEEHTSELQSRGHLVCRLLLEKKKKRKKQ